MSRFKNMLKQNKIGKMLAKNGTKLKDAAMMIGATILMTTVLNAVGNSSTHRDMVNIVYDSNSAHEIVQKYNEWKDEHSLFNKVSTAYNQGLESLVVAIANMGGAEMNVREHSASRLYLERAVMDRDKKGLQLGDVLGELAEFNTGDEKFSLHDRYLITQCADDMTESEREAELASLVALHQHQTMDYE